MATSGATSVTGTGSSVMVLPPAAPALDVPASNALVSSPLRVSGPAFTPPHAAGESIRVSLATGTGTWLASATRPVDTALGAPWQLDLPYDEPAADTALVLNVVRINANGESTPTTLALRQRGRVATEVVVSQETGAGTLGSLVVVQAFLSAEDILAPVAESSLMVTDGMDATGSVMLNLPSGQDVVLRAFRDVNLDGWPTFSGGPGGPEPQSVGVLRAANATGSSSVILRAAYGDMLAAYGFMDVRTVNEPASGDGCGGYRVEVEAMASGNTADLSPVMVRDPDGATTALSATHPCYHPSRNVHAWAEGSFPSAGRFIMGYRNTVADVVDVRVDTLDRFRRMPFRVVPTAPALGTRVPTTMFNVTWAEIPDANRYRVSVRQGNEPSPWTPPMAETSMPVSVADGSLVSVEISAEYAESMDDSDVDATAYGEGGVTYLVATSAASVITVSGTVANDSGLQGDAWLMLRACDAMNMCSEGATARVAGGAGPFSLPAFRQPMLTGELVARLVTPGGSLQGGMGPSARVQLDALDMDRAGMALRFYKALSITAPAEGATVGTQPRVTWTDWDALPGAEPAAWSYIFLVFPDGSGDFPAILYGLPTAQVSFDMANPPEGRFDVVPLATGGMAQSLPMIPAGPARISVGVLPCDIQASDYEMCLGAALSVGGNPLLTEAEVRVLVE